MEKYFEYKITTSNTILLLMEKHPEYFRKNKCEDNPSSKENFYEDINFLQFGT